MCLLYDVNAIQQDNFVCDNNQHYLNNNDSGPVSNNNNGNSIQAIVTTIIEVKMNGMFYILAKKKYILYLLIRKKTRSFHTSKKKVSPPFITKEIDKFCIYMATKFDHDSGYTILVCAVSYVNTVTTTNKRKIPSMFHDIFNNLDTKVPSQSQSLVNIYVVDTFWDQFCVLNNDTVPFTDTTSTNNVVLKTKAGSNAVNDCDFVHNNDCDHMNNKDNANSIQTIVATILQVRMHGIYIHDNNNNDCGNDRNGCNRASSTNNFKSRVDPVPGVFATSTNRIMVQLWTA